MQILVVLVGSVGCAVPTGDQEVAGFNPNRHSFVETDHEIFSAVILPLPLIQEEKLLVFGERMCINTG